MGAFGMISVKVNAKTYRAKGDFTYSLGGKKRTAIMGPTGVTGYKIEHVAPFIQGKIADEADIDIKEFFDITNATVDLALENGKLFTWDAAFSASDLSVTVDEGEIDFRFESEIQGEQV